MENKYTMFKPCNKDGCNGKMQKAPNKIVQNIIADVYCIVICLLLLIIPITLTRIAFLILIGIIILDIVVGTPIRAIIASNKLTKEIKYYCPKCKQKEILVIRRSDER